MYEEYGLLQGSLVQVVYDAPDEFLRGDCSAAVELAQRRREKGRSLVDNGWLLPGEFVVDGEGVVRLEYRCQYCANFPDLRALIAAVREANGE